MASGGLTEIARGAEAVLYKTKWLGFDAIVKIRLPKPYRHPKYDELFRYRRTLIEARVIASLKQLGLNVPSLFYVDPDKSILVIEYIGGTRLSNIINSISEDALKKIAYKLGQQVCVMHKNNIYHGDLTIANTVVNNDEVFIIDFGLAGYSTDVEEYAIDIHLLSRGLSALSPDRHDLFMEEFKKGYMEQCGAEFTENVFQRMREIRLRGRYVEERLRRKIALDKYM
ncbi:Kae1-associated kinase Bud32 [Desulfurococcaceae archaeon MEX13E-LK6-19]|nr:Kae1-associated kinase Bud32 [Desulfurococcaceae archaeon MEX13E-LK6-19]